MLAKAFGRRSVEPIGRADDSRYRLRHGQPDQAGGDGDLGHGPARTGQVPPGGSGGQLPARDEGERQGRDHHRATAPAPLGPDPRRPDLRLCRGAGGRLAEDRRARAPRRRPGERFIYSDVGFLVLGRLVEKVSGQSLDEFARAAIFDPLGMVDTGFRPVGGLPDEPTPVARIAPTEREGSRMLRGVVHDPRSRALGGVAGHAGLFGTADDLAVFAQMLLDGGKGLDGKRVLSPLTVRAMVDPGSTPEGQRRGLGWDVETSYSGPRGAPVRPDQLRPHRVHRDEPLGRPRDRDLRHPPDQPPPPRRQGGQPRRLAGRGRHAGRLVDRGRALEADRARGRRPARPSPPKAPAIRPVDCGVDVLARRGFRELKGKRVGLVTNHTGRTKAGVSTIDLLFEAPGVELVALFSPEHGIRGAVDTEVADAKDEKTGLPIFSLYGKTRKPIARDAWRASRSWSTTSRTSARATTPTSARSACSWRRPRRTTSRSSCSTAPTRSAAWPSPARSATPTSPRSSPTTPCPSATG